MSGLEVVVVGSDAQGWRIVLRVCAGGDESLEVEGGATFATRGHADHHAGQLTSLLSVLFGPGRCGCVEIA